MNEIAQYAIAAALRNKRYIRVAFVPRGNKKPRTISGRIIDSFPPYVVFECDDGTSTAIDLASPNVLYFQAW